MTNESEKIRALGLCSGGLDSILSALVLRRQGIDVTWISFETPFFSAAKAREAAARTGIVLRVRPITATYLKLLRNPRCGYGKQMNPCMDCHALMFRLAGEEMTAEGFDFMFSGEVLGQRPFSQTAQSLRYVEKQSGHMGLILRPLSAKRLPETLPEQKGWVDRDRLLDFSGRSRKPQIALAREFGVREYPTPAGGCLLTDKGFSDRLRDLFAHNDDPDEDELHLLRFGRHLRLDPECKIVVGRTKAENESIQSHCRPDRDVVLKVVGHPGPLVVMPGGGPHESLLLAAAVTAGYSKAPRQNPVQVKAAGPQGTQKLSVIALEPADVREFLV